MISDRRAMVTALVLARRGMGTAHPNPPVGAVVVRDGRIVGAGTHRKAGTPHAEVLALGEAGERARGATLFVTLEPCNHQGRTPACVPAIVEAGIRRVEMAVRDPNPLSKHGEDALRAAGIAVGAGMEARAARHLLAGFASSVERKRPRFAVKMASSLDGRIASPAGDARWISSETARAWVHRRRREADAVMVGAGTALKDDPRLTTRGVKGRSPDRIVLDGHLRTPAAARVWQSNGVRRIAVAAPEAPGPAREALAERGVEVWMLPGTAEGRIDLRALAERLGSEGYTNVLVEGGGTLAGALIEAHLADVIWLAMSRRMLLGGGGPGWTEGLRVPSVTRAVRVSRAAMQPLGPDWLFTLVPEYAAWWDPETGHV